MHYTIYITEKLRCNNFEELLKCTFPVPQFARLSIPIFDQRRLLLITFIKKCDIKKWTTNTSKTHDFFL